MNKEYYYSIDKGIRLYNLLLRAYSKREMTERNYEEMLQLLTSQLKKDGDKVQFERAYSILNKFYERNQEAFNNGTYQKFDELYKESILGDNKRQYDMSSLIDDGLIASQNGRKMYQYKKLNQNPQLFEYVDSLGRKIQIGKTGTLAFYQANQIEDYIENYRVSIEQDGEINIYDIFSNINIYKMSTDKKYQMAVLDELLSRNNITLSNSYGYIGEIEQNNEHNENAEVREKKSKYGYTYILDDDYQLSYDAITSSAVAIYAREKYKQNNQEKNNKVINLESYHAKSDDEAR